MQKNILLLVVIAALVGSAVAGMDPVNQANYYASLVPPLRKGEPQPLTAEEQGYLAKSSGVVEKGGWYYLNISGDPYERGFQHGYNLADQYAESIQTYEYITLQTVGMTYQFFVDTAWDMYQDKIPAEYMQEMSGIADGFTKAGVPATVKDVVGWNAYNGLTGYWWPTVQSKYGVAGAGKRFTNAHCSAFVATGNATADGRPVIAHTTFVEFWGGQYVNVVLSIKPTDGYAIIMQSSAGLISSMTDFFINSAGLAITETTIAGFQGFNPAGMPEFIRSRNATQYAGNIAEWMYGMGLDNDYAYANSWLGADTNTGEIFEFAIGKTTYSRVLTDGYIYGDNVSLDPVIRNLQCVDTGFSDVRQQTGARRTRWPQLLNKYFGDIDLAISQAMIGDNYDPYLKKENPSSRTLSSMYDIDPQPYVSDPNAVWNVPFYPAGSVDYKGATADMIESMTMSARFGRANGIAFDADSFFEEHPQWAWQQCVVKSRPSQPYVNFVGQK